MNTKQGIKKTGIKEIKDGETSDNNFMSLLEKAVKNKGEISFLRFAAPKKFRMQVISLIDPEIPEKPPNLVYEILINPHIKKLEFLLSNPFGEPFLRKMDSEGLTNWQTWRIRKQILKFTEGLLFIAKQRELKEIGPLTVGFHNNTLIWNLGILSDTFQQELLIRSYGKNGKHRGHNENIDELVLTAGHSSRLAESFINYYNSVKYSLDTTWMSSANQLDDFILKNKWPGLFKGNALRVDLIDLDRDENQDVDDVAKRCLHSQSANAERKWLSLDRTSRSKLHFFRMPSLSPICEKNFKWRGKALRMERIPGISLFELFSAIHRSFPNYDENRKLKASKIMGFFLSHSLRALYEFYNTSKKVLLKNEYQTYPYTQQLTSALENISAYLSILSPLPLKGAANEVESLGKLLESASDKPFRDAHLKNRLLRWEPGNTTPEIVTETLLDMDWDYFQGFIHDKIYDIDFETAYLKVSPWDDIAHILLFENIGLVDINIQNHNPVYQGEDSIALTEQWTGMQMDETSKDLFWKTLLFRSIREFCRRLWYAHSMPNTYSRRYSLEGRDYYLDLAVFCRIQTGSFPQLQQLLDLFSIQRDRLWRDIRNNSIEYLKPLLTSPIIPHAPGSQSFDEEKISRILNEIQNLKDKSKINEKMLELLTEIKEDSDTQKSLTTKFEDIINLKPNFMGIGIDLGKLIKKILIKG
jgi:hypothetical protein